MEGYCTEDEVWERAQKEAPVASPVMRWAEDRTMGSKRVWTRSAQGPFKAFSII